MAAFLAFNVVAAWAGTATPLGGPPSHTLQSVLALFTCQALCYVAVLDRVLVDSNIRLFSMRTLGLLGFLFLPLSVLAFVRPSVSLYGNILSFAAMSLVLMLAIRFSLRHLVRPEALREGHLILGNGPHAQKLYSELIDRCKGSAVRSAANSAIVPGSQIRCDQLRELAVRSGISTIVIAEPEFQNRSGLAAALLECKLNGLCVTDAIDSYERYLRKVRLADIRPDWFIYTDGFTPSRFYFAVKRLMDVLCAAALVVFAAPLVIAAAIAIKLDSPGPVLFRQSRVGLNGKIFWAWKFRTMYSDAERSTGPVWASDRDRRITPVGSILRSYRLDEIPQVLNVLRGEMSFIGPRPERPYFVDLLKEEINYYALRLCVKPGITGWAQVMYPYGASVQDSYEKLQYDLYYLKHMSFSVDLKILFKTVPVVLGGRGR